jgi:hypothetical protein
VSRVRPTTHPLGKIDRRWIFLAILLSVVIPMLLKLSIPTRPSPIVDAIFDKIESLPPGSKVLVSLDFAPSTIPENLPMSQAVVRHLLTRNQRVYLMTLWATGPDMITRATDVIAAEFPEKVYGTDFVNLGYKAGNQGVINSISANFKTLFTGDEAGTPIDQIPMTQEINTSGDFDLIISIASGFPGLKEWIQFAGDRVNVPVAGGVTAVEAPLLYPYYPRQLLGLMGGLQGAAEYEAALVGKYPHFRETSEEAIKKMGPQTVAHLLILALIVLGNVAYFLSQSPRGGRS